MRSREQTKAANKTTDARRLRASSRWVKLSAYMRKKYPVCYNPFNDHSVVEAAEVHHIFRIADYPELAYEKDNLVTLCKRCHGIITSLEGKDIDTQWLFATEGVVKSLGGKSNYTVCCVNSFLHDNLGGRGCKSIIYRNKPSIWCNRMKILKKTPCGVCIKDN